MLNSQRFRTILTLALPIIGGMLSQNILNLVDTAMVGQLGDEALAAVGISGFVTFMAVALVIGLSSGVQAMAARRKGEGAESEMATPLNGGLFLAVLMGLPISLVLFGLADDILPCLVDDAATVAQGVPYFEMRLLGMTAVGMNFAFRGYFNGVNQSGLYLRTLLVMHTLNIAISYVLIFGKLGLPAMGTQGAGLGTTLSVYFGTLYYFYLGWKNARHNGFLGHLPSREGLLIQLKLAIPSSIQQLFFAAGLTAMFWIIGQIGTTELAAASVLVNIMLVAILPGIGLGLAAASLVGQALGRGDPGDAKRWGWDVSKVGFIFLGLLGLPAIFFPDLLLSGFLHDPDTLELARLPLQIVGIGIAADGIGLILMNALLGAGASRVVMVVSIAFQWALFTPLAWYLGPYLGFGLLAVWIAQFAYRGLQAGVFAGLWQWGNWQSIKV